MSLHDDFINSAERLDVLYPMHEMYDVEVLSQAQCDTVIDYQPEGGFYGKSKEETVIFLLLMANVCNVPEVKTYRTVPQKGEMAYRQPFYGVEVIPADFEYAKIDTANLHHNTTMVISTLHYDYTCTVRETGEVKKWTTKAEYKVHLYKEAKRWGCAINCYSDVAALANYFGERMGAEFFERYKNILIVN